MTDRAVSTVLDVSVCLLLVGAAVLTLLGAPAPDPDPAAGRAQEVTSTLAGSTATVSYDDRGENLTTHGTLAGLLAEAAVANATPTPDQQFRAAVANATRPVLAAPTWRTQAVVTWRPYEGAEAVGVMRVGREPIADADVHAATMQVPSGLPPVRQEARAAADRDGYGGVATVVADSFPPSDGGARNRAARERSYATALERQFDSPAAAASAVSVGRVRVTVRAWSP